MELSFFCVRTFVCRVAMSMLHCTMLRLAFVAFSPATIPAFVFTFGRTTVTYAYCSSRVSILPDLESKSWPRFLCSNITHKRRFLLSSRFQTNSVGSDLLNTLAFDICCYRNKGQCQFLVTFQKRSHYANVFEKVEPRSHEMIHSNYVKSTALVYTEASG